MKVIAKDKLALDVFERNFLYALFDDVEAVAFHRYYQIRSYEIDKKAKRFDFEAEKDLSNIKEFTMPEAKYIFLNEDKVFPTKRGIKFIAKDPIVVVKGPTTIEINGSTLKVTINKQTNTYKIPNDQIYRNIYIDFEEKVCVDGVCYNIENANSYSPIIVKATNSVIINPKTFSFPQPIEIEPSALYPVHFLKDDRATFNGEYIEFNTPIGIYLKQELKPVTKEGKLFIIGEYKDDWNYAIEVEANSNQTTARIRSIAFRGSYGETYTVDEVNLPNLIDNKPHTIEVLFMKLRLGYENRYYTNALFRIDKQTLIGPIRSKENSKDYAKTKYAYMLGNINRAYINKDFISSLELYAF